MYCPRCGEVAAEGKRFCRRCGTPIASGPKPEVERPTAPKSPRSHPSYYPVVMVALVALVAGAGGAYLFLKKKIPPQQITLLEAPTGGPTGVAVQSAEPSPRAAAALPGSQIGAPGYREAATPRPSPAPVGRAGPPASQLQRPAVATVSRPEPTPLAAAQPATVPEPVPLPLTLTPVERRITIPAGTAISVRLIEALSSDRNRPGDRFTASLHYPLVVEGVEVAPRGALLEGFVVEAMPAGRVEGVALLSLRLASLHAGNGQVIAIQTEPYRREGQRSLGRDVKRGALMSGIGAAIGAIAGGGKGAALGAAIGGGAGAGTALATRGNPVELPSETVLEFRLREPLGYVERQAR